MTFTAKYRFVNTDQEGTNKEKEFGTIQEAIEFAHRQTVTKLDKTLILKGDKELGVVCYQNDEFGFYRYKGMISE